MAERPEDSRRLHKSSNRSGRWDKYGVLHLLRAGEHGTWAKRAAGRLSRRLSILGSLLLVIFCALIPLGAMAQEEPTAPSSDSVWYAAGTSIVRLNTESGQAAGSVPLSSQTSPVSSLASHPTDGSVAVLARGRLLGFDTSGTKTFEAPVAAASSLGTAPVLATDPHDGSLWVGGSGLIVLADARGQNERTIKLNTGEVVKGIFASQGGGAYALTHSRLLRFSKAGEVISQRQMSTVGVKSPVYLAVDEYGGLGYVANTTTIAQVSLDKPADPPIRKIKPTGGVAALSVNPFDGTLYVANRPSSKRGSANLYAYDDGNGLLLKKASFQAKAVRTLSFDTPSQTLWLGTDSKVLGFHKDLSSKAQIAASGLNTLSAAPLSLTSHVSLLEPQDGATTTNPQQPIKLSLKAFCNNEMCPAGFGYGSKLALKASLNGQAVSSQFQISGDAGSASGAEASYTPASGLPEGTNTLVAEAVDTFGGRSNHLEATFTVDTTAPSFLEVKPEDGSVLSEQPVTITGRVDDPNARVYLEGLEDLGGKVISSDPGGFSFEVPLKEGENSFRLLAYDEADNLGEYPLKLLYEAPLELTITEPAQDSTVNTDKVTVKGTVKGPEGTTVHVGEVEASIDPEGNFVAEDVQLVEGANSIVVEAIAPNGKSTQQTLDLTYEPVVEPALTITEPENGSTVTTQTVTVKGTVEGPEGTTVRVGEVEASVDSQGNYVAENVQLSEGRNRIAVEATAPSGESDQETLDVIYRIPGDPPIIEPPVDPEPTVRDERPPDSPVSTPGPLPPDPEQVAPPVEQGVPTDMADSTSFLYEGANPVQTGVADDAIQDSRVAVLKGKVLNRLGEPVPGVRITVLDHPEYGETLTREDGEFDLAVNGGGTVTLVYEKDRYMSAQRQVEASWSDFAAVEDVVLVGYSRRVTDVDLAGTDGMLVAQGSAITDVDGTRQSTMLLPGDTQAEMVMPDGTTQPLPQMDFRATEYTVGEDGPEAMPAPLPSTSAYTYAVELSADEAVEAGAEEVRFSKPLYNYVDNFLGFPVGAAVPNGYYDEEKGQWIGADNGRVVKVLSITDGLADLDVDGSGNAADAAALQALGITDEEREKLAGLYGEGKTLWRMPIDHFTPWDYNFPYGPPDDSTYPDQGPPPDTGPESDPDCQGGSIIDCQNQILGENLGVSGAPFSLHYGSDGVTGHKVPRTLKIPLSGAKVPSSLGTIALEVEVAGQEFKKYFEPKPNLSYTYTWDGKDGYGRAVTGEQDVKVRVGYIYGLVYRTPADFYRSWALLGSYSSSSSGGGGGGGCNCATAPFDIIRPSKVITLWQEGQGKVASYSWDDRSQGMGGWTPDILHQYDPEGRTLRLGDGTMRRGESLGRTITTAAGTGSDGLSGDGGQAKDAQLNTPQGAAFAPDGALYVADTWNHRVRKVAPDGTITTIAGTGSDGFSGDGGPATNAQLRFPQGVAVAQDGTLYVADMWNHRVRKVAPDGTISTVAGTGSDGFSGEGGLATDAQLNTPQAVAVAPDGALYIADSYNHRVRRVSPDGIITTVAGTGERGFSGDDGEAPSAKLNQPEGLAVGPSGTVYIADTWNHRVRKVTPDGTITTVAGKGSFGFSGDDGPAKDAQLRYPGGVVVAPDGVLYIADTWNHRVRRVATDGIITTVAGTGEDGFSGEAGPPVNAQLSYPLGPAVAPDGALYVADSNNHRVRKVTTPMPGTGADEIPVPSGDGAELYVFDKKGKHQRTLDAATGVVLHRFSYDGAGRLISVEDVDGLKTQIERDASSGDATAVVAPSGERTELAMDERGYLASVSNPAGETVQLAYDGSGSGLLQSLTDPKTNTTHFTYDELGRLTKDEDPAGGYKELSRTDGNQGSFTTNLTRASGRKDTYAVEKLSDESSRRLHTDPSGLETETIRGNGGYRKITVPDGTTLEASMGPDPRFGIQSPVVERATMKTPSGLGRTTTASRVAILADPNNPLSATSITEKVTTGDRVSSSTWDKASNTITGTSPAGRSATTKLDAKGRPIEETASGFAPTSYEYDERGRLTKETFGTGTEARTTTYSYDEKDRLTSVTYPLDKEWRFEYDAAGRVVREVGPGGQAVSYDYDQNGNLISMTPPGQPAHEFAYDSRNLGTSYTAPKVGTEDRTTSIENDFDRLPTSQTLPGGEKIEYLYDAGGRLQKVSYPGSEKTYTYDPKTGNPATVSNASGTLSYAFDGFLPLSETSSGQVPGKVQASYDNDLRVKGMSVNGSPEVAYSYDKDGLITKDRCPRHFPRCPARPHHEHHALWR